MLVFAAFALFSPLLALAQDTQHTNVTDFPDCAIPCLAAGFKAQPLCWSTNRACMTAFNCTGADDYPCLVQNGCGYTNDTCVCSDEVFGDAVANCTSTACDMAGQKTTADIANSQCVSIAGHLDFITDSNGTMEATPAETTLPTEAVPSGHPSATLPPAPAPYEGKAGKMKMVAGFMMGTMIGVVSALVML